MIWPESIDEHLHKVYGQRSGYYRGAAERNNNGIGRLSMQNPHKGGYTAATADAKMVAQKLHDKSSESMSADFRVSPGPNDTLWKN